MLRYKTADIGIDLGTANTIVIVKGKGIVVREPSVIAKEKNTNKVVAVGNEAKKMIGRTHGKIITIRPMRDGAIADYENTTLMLNDYINQAKKQSIFSSKPRIVVCVPSGVTSVEKRAVIDAVIQAGAREVVPIEEAFAAAIGAGLPVWESTGSMVVDIGGGTTKAAIISLGGIVISQSISEAGDEMDQTIMNYVRKTYNLIIGEHTAEQIKIEMGQSETEEEEEEDIFKRNVNGNKEIRGRDLLTGLPKSVEISDYEVREALSDTIHAIVELVRATLEQTPPELAADILERGIVLTGGGAMLRGLNEILIVETKIPVFIADNPLDCVVNGTAEVFKNLHLLHLNVTVSVTYRKIIM